MKIPAWTTLLGPVVLAVGFLWFVGRQAERTGELNQKIKARETVIAVLANQKARVDTAYHTDTVNLGRWKARYDSLLKKMPENFNPPGPLKEIIVAADSTIHACSVALETCEHRVAIRDTTISQQDSLIHEIKKQHRSPFLGCRLGVSVTPKGFGPGVTCGIGR